MKALHSRQLNYVLNLPGGHTRAAGAAGRRLPDTPLAAPAPRRRAGAAPLSRPQPQLPSPGDTSARCPASPEPPQRGHRFPPLPSPIAARGDGAREDAGRRPGCRRRSEGTRGKRGARSRSPERHPVAPLTPPHTGGTDLLSPAKREEARRARHGPPP